MLLGGTLGLRGFHLRLVFGAKRGAESPRPALARGQMTARLDGLPTDK